MPVCSVAACLVVPIHQIQVSEKSIKMSLIYHCDATTPCPTHKDLFPAFLHQAACRRWISLPAAGRCSTNWTGKANIRMLPRGNNFDRTRPSDRPTATRRKALNEWRACSVTTSPTSSVLPLPPAGTTTAYCLRRRDTPAHPTAPWIRTTWW